MVQTQQVDGITNRATHQMEVCPACGCGGPVALLQGPDRFHGGKQLYKLVRCSACSLVWLDEPPRAEEMGQHYGTDYDRFIGAGGETSPGRWRDRQETLLKYKPRGRLLDLGCSTGSFLTSLKGLSWELYGIEISPDAAEKAKTRSGAEVFVGDILDAKFEPGSFDVITSFDVLEHLYEPQTVLKKISTWLKPGGIYYTLVPNIEAWEAKLFRSYWYGLELPRHLFHYSPDSLRNMAKTAGLRELSVTTHANSAFEYSTYYVVNDLLNGLGLSRPPLASSKARSLPSRVVSKAIRLTILPLISGTAQLVGAGESIHAVFQKSLTGAAI